MSLLDRRNTSAGIIEQRFITASLEKMGKEIINDVTVSMNRSKTLDKDRMKRLGYKKKYYKMGFSSSKFKNIAASADGNILTYTHNPANRYADMSNRKNKSGKKAKINNHPIHNKPIWSNKRFLVKELSFGFTDAVKKQFSDVEQKANH